MAGESNNSTSIADFEKSLDELEKLVRDLEQGELSLEQSLAAFERGVKLTRECQSALKSAEQRAEQLALTTNLPGASSRPRFQTACRKPCATACWEAANGFARRCAWPPPGQWAARKMPPWHRPVHWN